MAQEIGPGGCAAKLVAEGAKLAEELLSRGESPGGEPRQALGGVPASEALDDRLGMHMGAAVAFEFAHRRRAAQAQSALLQLGENLVVRVTATHAGLEGGKIGGVDLHGVLSAQG